MQSYRMIHAAQADPIAAALRPGDTPGTARRNSLAGSRISRR